MSIGFHFDDDDADMFENVGFYLDDDGIRSKADWIERKKRELIADSSIAFGHWRDFDAEAEAAWRARFIGE